MGVRARNGNDRLRTIWTPEMDKYFIGLLLEQVSKGNKFDDHLFSKRAWKSMTLLFNSKFKFQYEKDVLKNRHKTLRNLYKAVKKLLDQNGFSWDENRLMITADNNVWDEYVKMHPDARAFRIKTIPHYKDLCLIYGDSNIDEKADSEAAGAGATQDKSAGEEDMDSFQGIIVDEGFEISMSNVAVDDSVSKDLMDVTGSTATNRSRTCWQPPMDRFFVDLMVEHMRKGNQIDGVFRKQAWIDMITVFNAKFGFNYNVDVLKNRYKTLRRQHNVIKNLLELPGFAWDDTRQMVTADDFVWQDYIKTHTDARQFMTRPVPYYNELCMIFSDQTFDGNDCFSSQCLELQNDFQDVKFPRASQGSLSPPASVSSEEEIGDLLESLDAATETALFYEKKKRQSKNPLCSVHPKKLRGKQDRMAGAPHEMVTGVSSLLEKRKDENTDSISIENVVKAVQAVPDMDEELILDACDFLEDEMKAKTFMALDIKLRKKWLLRKLRPQL
ncbi:L10-interacting MYB domain-containing protein [Mercurialis annua]|uniref:L10-interacting MYB domain-containing protein n=1 Tax=Mercurialis annua TaxID=3986 RepID=UPI00215EEB68|nr:L10-interacting MYB domain-containing protein [Mercurialis annua]